MDVSPNYPSNGNLIISSDSTFLIKGYDAGTSHVPGWHSGGTMKGTWAMPDRKHLMLLPNEADKIFASAFTFKIITLDNTTLAITSSLDPQDTSGIHMIFRRE